MARLRDSSRDPAGAEGARHTHRGSAGQPCGRRAAGRPPLCAGLLAPSWFFRMERRTWERADRGEAWRDPRPRPPAPSAGASLAPAPPMEAQRPFRHLDCAQKGNVYFLLQILLSWAVRSGPQHLDQTPGCQQTHTFCFLLGRNGQSEVVPGEHPPVCVAKVFARLVKAPPEDRQGATPGESGRPPQPPDHPLPAPLLGAGPSGTPLPAASV